MENLFDIRQDIKYRLAFQKKLKDQPEVVQFFFTLKKLIDFQDNYEAPEVPEKRGSRMFSSMVISKRVPSLKEKYPTFDDYLNMVVFKSTMPSDYQLVGQPYIGMSVHEIDSCLSRWRDTEALYQAVRKRILENKGMDLNLVKDEPSVLTLNKLLNPEDYSFMKQTGRDSATFPFVSFFPFLNLWKFRKPECKEFLQICLVCLIVAILGIIGICIDKQPYTWIGAAAVSIILAVFLGGIIYNITTLFTHGEPKKGSWVPGTVGFAAGVICFFCSYSVTPPAQSSNFYSTPTRVYDSYDSEDNTIVYTTEYGECYHSTPNCPTLARSRNIYETSKSRARRSYRPCQKCH